MATSLAAALRAKRNATSAGLHTTGLPLRTKPSAAASAITDSKVTIPSKSSSALRPIRSRHFKACASSALVKISLATLGGMESKRAFRARLCGCLRGGNRDS